MDFWTISISKLCNYFWKFKKQFRLMAISNVFDYANSLCILIDGGKGFLKCILVINTPLCRKSHGYAILLTIAEMNETKQTIKYSLEKSNFEELGDLANRMNLKLLISGDMKVCLFIFCRKKISWNSALIVFYSRLFRQSLVMVAAWRIIHVHFAKSTHRNNEIKMAL